jgi:uncharacterized protein with GYD domain
MGTYMMLSRWTDRGITNVKDAPARIDAFKKTASAVGGEVREVYLALGKYDTVSLISAPDDEAVAKLALSLCSAGNVHTETLRLFSESEFRKMMTALP